MSGSVRVTVRTSDEVLAMSDAVQRAHDRHRGEELTAFDVALDLLNAHPEYADGRAGSFDVGTAPPDAQRLLFTEWLARVRPLFDPAHVDRLTTRIVVWGLALLDHGLRGQLERDGFLTAFRAHRTEEILSPEGQALLLDAGIRPGTAITSDTWSAHDDLEYELYADAIVAFIVDDRTRAPLTIGLKAPWGGGKTSLMRMVRRRLDPDAEAMPVKGRQAPRSGSEDHPTQTESTVPTTMRTSR
jgi:hypothetical protein